MGVVPTIEEEIRAEASVAPRVESNEEEDTLMVYALNVFNLASGREKDYAEYSVKAGKIIYGLDGRVVASGWKPLRSLHGDRERQYFIVVEFPSEAVFQQFLEEGERQRIHPLREESTTDYIWTLYEAWDLRAWVRKPR